MLKHPHLQPYVPNLHLNFNNPRHHRYPVRWSDYAYEKKTTYIDHKPEPQTVYSHRNQKQSFSSDRALNPSISEHDQLSLCLEKVHDLSRSLTKKLSTVSINEKTPVPSKTPIAIKTPRFTPAKTSTPRRETTSTKITRGGSNRDLVCP